MPANSKTLIEKIEALPAERIAEIEDFVDFIRFREQERALTRAAAPARATMRITPCSGRRSQKSSAEESVADGAVGEKHEKEIDSLKHREARRKHIPTTELESLVSDDEQAPKAIRWKRNTDLDPQLVWRGKDEQDAEDLMVDSVPIYIQEKIQPEAIIRDLFRRSEAIRREREERERFSIPDLFCDFNGLSEPGAEFVFYQHEKNWSNRMILGDSLLVMNSLAEKEALKGQVQCIYMDPPYGIRFNSNWQPSTKSRDVKDGQSNSLSREPEMIRAFSDTWKDGVHSYLSY